MGGGGCERHGEGESKTNRSNSGSDIQTLREVKKDRGVQRTRENKDNKKRGDAEVRR